MAYLESKKSVYNVPDSELDDVDYIRFGEEWWQRDDEEIWVQVDNVEDVTGKVFDIHTGRITAV